MVAIILIIVLTCGNINQIDSYTPSEYYTSRSINIVYVQPIGEEYTDTEKSYTDQSVKDAFTFWSDLIPTPDIHERDQLNISSNPYNSLITEWCNCSFTKEITNTLTIFVIDNSVSKADLLGSAGYPSEYFSFIVVILDASPISLAAQIAHEMGHIYFYLPDFYKTNPCQGIDIMCYPQKAYERKFYGCLTKQFLADKGFGQACYRVNLPFITQ